MKRVLIEIDGSKVLCGDLYDDRDQLIRSIGEAVLTEIENHPDVECGEDAEESLRWCTKEMSDAEVEALPEL